MSAPPRDVETRLLQALSVDQRLALSAELRRSAWSLRRSVIAAEFPELDDRELDDAVRAAFSTST